MLRDEARRAIVAQQRRRRRATVFAAAATHAPGGAGSGMTLPRATGIHTSAPAGNVPSGGVLGRVAVGRAAPKPRTDFALSMLPVRYVAGWSSRSLTPTP
jgi:hypothetical protein